MRLQFLILSVICTILFFACEKDDPIIVNEEELITTLEFRFISADMQDTIMLRYMDLDGDGPENPVVETENFIANSMYNGEIRLLNETIVPVQDVTEELREEDEDHQFFFSSDSETFVISYDDEDDEGKPIGLSTKLNTGDSFSGGFTIILRHKPIKDAEGVSNGDITNAGGETDIEVTFTIDVE